MYTMCYRHTNGCGCCEIHWPGSDVPQHCQIPSQSSFCQLNSTNLLYVLLSCIISVLSFQNSTICDFASFLMFSPLLSEETLQVLIKLRLTKDENNSYKSDHFLNPLHNEVVGGVYWFHSVRPSICPSVRPSVCPSVRLCLLHPVSTL